MAVMSQHQLSLIIKARDEASAQLSRVNTGLSTTRATVEKTNSAFAQMRSTIDRTLNSLNRFATTGLKIVGAELAALTTAIVTFTKASEDFEHHLANAMTMFDSSVKEMEKARTQIHRLAIASGVDMKEIADGYYAAGSAGVKFADAQKVVGDALVASIAGNTKLNDTLQSAIGIQRAYKKEHLSLATIYATEFQAVKKGQLTFEELASTFGIIGPAASQLGVSFRSAIGAYTTLTTMGMSAAQASTYTAAAFKDISQNAEKFNKIGVKIYDSSGKFVGLYAVIKQLRDKMAGLSDAEKNVLLNSLGLEEQGKRAIVSFVGGLEDMQRITKSLNGSTAELEAAYKIQAASISYTIARLKTSFQALMDSVTAALSGPITGIMRWLIAGLRDVGKWIDLNKKQFADIVSALFRISILLASIFASIKVFSFLYNLLNPLNLAILGIVGGLYAFWAAFHKGESIIDFVKWLYDGIKNFTKSLAGGLSKSWDTIATSFWSLIDLVNKLDAMIVTGLQTTWNWAVTGLQDVIAIKDWLGDKIHGVITTVWNWTIDKIDKVLEFFKSFGEVAAWFGTEAQKTWQITWNWVIGDFNKIVEFFKSFGVVAAWFGTELSKTLTTIWSWVVDSIPEAVLDVMKWFGTTTKKVLQTSWKWVLNGVDAIKEFLKGIKNYWVDTFTTTWNIIMSYSTKEQPTGKPETKPGTKPEKIPQNSPEAPYVPENPEAYKLGNPMGGAKLTAPAANTSIGSAYANTSSTLLESPLLLNMVKRSFVALFTTLGLTGGLLWHLSGGITRQINKGVKPVVGPSSIPEPQTTLGSEMIIPLPNGQTLLHPTLENFPTMETLSGMMAASKEKLSPEFIAALNNMTSNVISTLTPMVNKTISSFPNILDIGVGQATFGQHPENIPTLIGNMEEFDTRLTETYLNLQKTQERLAREMQEIEQALTNTNIKYLSKEQMTQMTRKLMDLRVQSEYYKNYEKGIVSLNLLRSSSSKAMAEMLWTSGGSYGSLETGSDFYKLLYGISRAAGAKTLDPEIANKLVTARKQGATLVEALEDIFGVSEKAANMIIKEAAKFLDLKSKSTLLWGTNFMKLPPTAGEKGYATGGYTGGISPDWVAGVVHGGEYVIPAWLVKKYPNLIASLEGMRIRGYKDGKLVNGDIKVEESHPITIDSMFDALNKFFSGTGATGSDSKLAGTTKKIFGLLAGYFGNDSSVNLHKDVESLKDGLYALIPIIEKIDPEVAEGLKLMKKNEAEQSTTASSKNTTAWYTGLISVLSGAAGQISNFVGQTFGELITKLGVAFSELSNAVVILDPISVLTKGIMNVIGSEINTALAPLYQMLLVTGNLLGTVLLPAIELTAGVIKDLGNVFVWLYNTVMIPVGKGLYVVFSNVVNGFRYFYNFFSDVIKGITFGLIDLGHKAVKTQKEISDAADEKFHNIPSLGDTGNIAGVNTYTATVSRSGPETVNNTYIVNANDSFIFDSENKFKTWLAEVIQDMINNNVITV